MSTDPLKFAARPREPLTTDGCLDAERLAAWLEDGLSANAAAAVEAHLAECARCQAMLAAFASTEEVAATAPVQAPIVVPFRPRPVMRWLLPAAGLAAASLAAWAVWPRTPVASPAVPQEMTFAKAVAPAETRSADAPTPAASPVLSQTGTARQSTDRVASLAKKSTEAAAQSLGRAGTVVPMPAPPPPPAPMTTTAGAAPLPGVVGATPLPLAPPPARPNPLNTGPDNLNLRASNREEVATALQSRVVAEFGPPTTPTPTVGQSFAGNARAAGGRGGGGAGGGVRAGGAALAADRALPHVKWRVLASGQVAKAINGSDTWEIVTIRPTVFVLNGAAPSDAVCWLVGRAGVVLLSTDGGVKFQRLVFPDLSDLRSITATDARLAKVTTTDGRVFETEDGGESWRLGLGTLALVPHLQVHNPPTF